MDQAQDKGPMRPAYRTLSDAEQEKVTRLKEIGTTFWEECDAWAGRQSREMNIAKTKIEEAVMWAVKGVTN